MLGLSALGLVHTSISLVAVISALVLFALRGRIDPNQGLGKLYLVCTAIGCLTAFGLSKHGGFNPGHALAILTLICLIVGIAVERKGVKGWPYIQVVSLSLSLFFSLIPAVNETLTRLPLGAPLAQGPQDPLVLRSLGILFGLFVVVLGTQLVSIYRKSFAKQV